MDPVISAGVSPRNLSDLVRAAGLARPDRVAFICGDEQITWAALDAAVDSRARGLLAAEMVAGDRVALALGNTLDFVVSYFAVLRADLVAVPLNPDAAADEVVHQLTDSGARALLCLPELAARLDSGRPDGLDVVAVVSDEPGAPAGTLPMSALDVPGEPVPPAAGAEDLAVLLYTAGTTGRPRGAMLSHRALLANLHQLAEAGAGGIGGDDVVLLVLPLFHVYGLNAGLGAVARQAATGVLAPRFDPVETLAVVRRHGVTNILGAPPMYVAWSLLSDAVDAFSGVRIAVSGAAPLPPSVMEAFERVTDRPVFQGYGMTEAAPVITTTLGQERPKPGSIGRPLPGIELRLCDESGHAPDEGDPGEIVVRGANLFSGYWPDGAGGPDGDGWFATGDVAYADGDGDLFIVDRLRELIIVSGFNVYPREVEAVLESHPEVREAAVVGVPHPYTGESVKAFVVRRKDSTLTAAELIDFVAQSLARFKCPTSVEFVDRLPRGTVGKLSRGRLRGRRRSGHE